MAEPLRSDDAAYWMLQRGIQEEFAIANGADIPEEDQWVSKSSVFNDRCYICNDREFALMGLPLCYPCEVVIDGVKCGSHVAADDCVCDEGHDMQAWYETKGEEF